MCRHTIMIAALSLCVLSAPRTWAKSEADSDAQKKAGTLTITQTELDVSDKTLKLSYKIRNDSGQDAWILVGTGKSGADTTAFMGEDDRTLLMRQRLDEPSYVFANPFHGRYVRLPSGQTQSESVCLAIPVHPYRGIARRRRARGLEYATRLAVEIGYYTGDLPAMVRAILEEAERTPHTKPVVYPTYATTVSEPFGGLLGFNESNEGLRSRDEEVLIPYTRQAFKGEQVIRLTVDGLSIPYEEEEDRSKRYPPDLTACTEVEVQYRPSMLEYFFPFTGQQSLLSPTEMEYLRSKKTIVVRGREDLKALAREVSKGLPAAGIVRERSAAHVVCYQDGERLMSFPIYNDESIVTEGRYRYMYSEEGLRSLKVLTPQIQAFEFRVRCAANLKDLWHRLRLYHKAKKAPLEGLSGKSEMVYPAPTEWCDAMVQVQRMTDEYVKKPHMCPGAGEGRSHYALNPNCEPSSPPDTVLLSETKAGWNQHGGPELFTFDNHEPRGGCVLLNDGAVKFIRTTEEFQQLRWK